MEKTPQPCLGCRHLRHSKNFPEGSGWCGVIADEAAHPFIVLDPQPEWGDLGCHYFKPKEDGVLKTFTVFAIEKIQQRYRVNAENEEEAKRIVANGGGTVVGKPEYRHKDDKTEDWLVAEMQGKM